MIGYEWSFNTIFSSDCMLDFSLTACRANKLSKRFSFSFRARRQKHVETVRYDPHGLIYLRRSAPYAERISEIVRLINDYYTNCARRISDHKIPTLKNGALNRGRSSTLYEYAEPRNVTEF